MKQTLSPQAPARVRRGQLRALALGLGASTLAMACSFGEIEGDDGLNAVPPNVDPATAAPGATDDGAAVTPVGPAVVAPAQTNTAADDDAAYTGDDPFQSELGKQVKLILEVNCANCHQGTKNGDMDYVLELDQLVKNGKIIPGDKEDSNLFIRMQQQSMPPAFMRTQRPTYSQIDQVGLFIDELPKDIFGKEKACNSLDFVEQDEQIALMAQDISRLDANDQPFTRYLNITYSTNAGDCDLAINRQRYALFKGINSVSTNTQIGKPVAINEEATIYRIDIRDYNWNREIDLQDDGVVDFDDAWLAIVDGAGQYAVEYTGDQAQDLIDDSTTAVPFLPVNAFIQFTETDDLYYSLIGARANLFDFEKEVLLVDTAAEIAQDNLLRAGFSNS
ncbi:MAG: hypothetical protein RL033_3305, partial [Pseudomonadota bacterium]